MNGVVGWDLVGVGLVGRGGEVGRGKGVLYLGTGSFDVEEEEEDTSSTGYDAFQRGATGEESVLESTASRMRDIMKVWMCVKHCQKLQWRR